MTVLTKMVKAFGNLMPPDSPDTQRRTTNFRPQDDTRMTVLAGRSVTPRPEAILRPSCPHDARGRRGCLRTKAMSKQAGQPFRERSAIGLAQRARGRQEA